MTNLDNLTGLTPAQLRRVEEEIQRMVRLMLWEHLRIKLGIDVGAADEMWETVEGYPGLSYEDTKIIDKYRKARDDNATRD